MDDYVETGIPLNANVSSELLINIFIPNTPLHDGAVIMQGSTIKAAACYLPLSESPFISKELGTRHRDEWGSVKSLMYYSSCVGRNRPNFFNEKR